MLKFGSPSVTLSLLVQNCTVKAGCIVYTLKMDGTRNLFVNICEDAITSSRNEVAINSCANMNK